MPRFVSLAPTLRRPLSDPGCRLNWNSPHTGGFNPAWFAAVGIAALLALFSARDLSENTKLVLRTIALVAFVIGGIGLLFDFHNQYELRWPIAGRATAAPISMTTPYETPQPAAVATITPASSPTAVMTNGDHPYDPYVTPKYLTDLFKGRTDAQGHALVKSYIGRTIGASGKVFDIIETGTRAKPLMGVIFGPSPAPQVSLVFGKKWFEQLNALHKADKIHAMGVIDSVRRDSVTLVQCEIVSVGDVGESK